MTANEQIKQAIREHEREKNRSRSIQAIMILFVVVPLVVLGLLFVLGAFA